MITNSSEEDDGMGSLSGGQEVCDISGYYWVLLDILGYYWILF